MWREAWLGYMCACEWGPTLPFSAFLVFLPGVPNACYTSEWFFVRLGINAGLIQEVPWMVLSDGYWVTWIFVPHFHFSGKEGSVLRFLPPNPWCSTHTILHTVREFLLLFPENELHSQSGTPKPLTFGNGVSPLLSSRVFLASLLSVSLYSAPFLSLLFLFLLSLLQVWHESGCWETGVGMVYVAVGGREWWMGKNQKIGNLPFHTLI